MEAVQQIVGALPGIRQAPELPPEQANAYPFLVCYPADGRWEGGPAGAKKGLHTLVLELHVQRVDLPRAVGAALAYAEAIPNALLADPTLRGTVSTFGAIQYQFGPLRYGDKDTLGFRFRITDIKQQSAVTAG